MTSTTTTFRVVQQSFTQVKQQLYLLPSVHILLSHFFTITNMSYLTFTISNFIHVYMARIQGHVYCILSYLQHNVIWYCRYLIRKLCRAYLPLSFYPLYCTFGLIFLQYSNTVYHVYYQFNVGQNSKWAVCKNWRYLLSGYRT